MSAMYDELGAILLHEGEALSAAKIERGLTNRFLGKQCQRSMSSIQKFMTGHRVMTARNLRLLCSLCGVDAAPLMERRGEWEKRYSRSLTKTAAIWEQDVPWSRGVVKELA